MSDVAFKGLDRRGLRLLDRAFITERERSRPARDIPADSDVFAALRLRFGFG